MNRIKIFLYPLLIALVALSSCQQERSASELEAGERVSVSLSVDVPCYAPMRTAMQQANIDENVISSLHLLVFNEAGLMVDHARATNITKTGDGKYSFTANIRPQREKCVIHFVANRNNISGASLLGKKESDALLSNLVTMQQVIDTKTIPMWARMEYNKIEANADLGEIKLLRSMAKFTLVVNPSSKLSDVSYTLCKSYECGTVAPFDPSKEQYAEAFRVEGRMPTVPRETFAEDLGWYNPNDPIYGFERHNKSANPISCLIIRAKYNGASDYSYYKLDFVNTNNRVERYDLIRNYWYKMTIKEAFAPGAATREAALAGVAINNQALSEELQAYPSFYNGKGLLQVEQNNFLFTQSERTLTFQAQYTPQGTNTPQNSKLRIIDVRHTTPDPAITDKNQVSIDSSGKVTAHLQTPLSGKKRISEIIIGVDGDPDLMRVVRVEVREPYNYSRFSVNGSIATNNQATLSFNKPQKSDLTFEITLPEDFERLPMQLRFFTEHFYPTATQTTVGAFVFGIKDGKSCYTTTVSAIPADRKLVCTFLSNKEACAETIEVVSVDKLFHTQRVVIQNY